MSRSWTIGNGEDCDVVVNRPTVSGHHCRLTRDGDGPDGGYTLEDLGSTNGTYVNGARIAARTPVRVAPGDAITLGQAIPMPWPSEVAGPGPGPKVLRIGREADNDFVVNLPTVSGHHARVVWEGKPGEAILEDLRSSNGTAVGAPDRKITRSVITASDMVYLGTHAVAASELLARLDPAAVSSPPPWAAPPGPDPYRSRESPTIPERRPGAAVGATIPVPPPPPPASTPSFSPSMPPAPSMPPSVSPATWPPPAPPPWAPALSPSFPPPSASASASTSTSADMPPPPPLPTAAGDWPTAPGWDDFREEALGMVEPPWLPAVLLVQPLLAALAIVLTLRSDVPASASTPTAEAGGSIAAVLFWLGLAAIWFGLSDALLAVSFRPEAARVRGAARLVPRLALLGAVAAIQCLLAWVVVTRGVDLRGTGLAALALLVLAATVGLALGQALVLLVPRPAFAWAVLPLIVGLLWLLGGQWRPLPRMGTLVRTAAAGVPSRWAFEGLLLLESDRRSEPTAGRTGGDMAEGYFPAETERMGVTADTLALGAMLLGLVAATLFIATGPGSNPGSGVEPESFS
jgi:pSer/pThr/pTyr-binding forkhead associated (FHA) protein